MARKLPRVKLFAVDNAVGVWEAADFEETEVGFGFGFGVCDAVGAEKNDISETVDNLAEDLGVPETEEGLVDETEDLIAGRLVEDSSLTLPSSLIA